MSYSNLVAYCDQFIILILPPKSTYFQLQSFFHHHFKPTSVCKMNGSKSICWLVLVTALLLQTICWVSASSRSLITDDHLPPTLQPGSDSIKIPQDAEDISNKASKIGSSPPSCDGKCYGCSPCEPIQVPTITSRIGLQYANYEPEGWKCKCGPLFYSP